MCVFLSYGECFGVTAEPQDEWPFSIAIEVTAFNTCSEQFLAAHLPFGRCLFPIPEAAGVSCPQFPQAPTKAPTQSAGGSFLFLSQGADITCLKMPQPRAICGAGLSRG